MHIYLGLVSLIYLDNYLYKHTYMTLYNTCNMMHDCRFNSRLWNIRPIIIINFEVAQGQCITLYRGVYLVSRPAPWTSIHIDCHNNTSIAED